MNDSTASTAITINLRNKGLKNKSGMLMKGCVKDATSKLSIGSIPSNYETIIYQNQATKGFGTSQKRFYQQQSQNANNSTLHSGTLSNSNILSGLEDEKDSSRIGKRANSTDGFFNKKQHQSHSVKGYGPFINRQQRNWLAKINGAPGPGRYQSGKTADQMMREIKNSKKWRSINSFKSEDHKIYLGKNTKNKCNKTFSLKKKQQLMQKAKQKERISHSSFENNIRQDNKIKFSENNQKVRKIQQYQTQNNNKQNSSQKVNKQFVSPGPGQYDITVSAKQKLRSNNLLGWKSSFKSKLSRDSYLQNYKGRAAMPGPGYYDVKLIKHAKSVIKLKQNALDQHLNHSQDDHIAISPQKRQKHLKNLHNPNGYNKQNSPLPSSLNVPGPGSYNYEIPTFKPLYQRIKISGNFIMAKKDRFNNVIDKYTTKTQDKIVQQYVKQRQKAPNMYSYDLKSAFDSQEKLIKYACFMSEEKRHLWKDQQKKLGPGLIDVTKNQQKQDNKNFHFNIKGDWF